VVFGELSGHLARVGGWEGVQMKVSGINFTHRRVNDKRSFVAKDYAQFTSFASLLAVKKVNHCVQSVFFDHKVCAFDITCDEAWENTFESEVIEWCAKKTLSQYFLFGYCGHGAGLHERED